MTIEKRVKELLIEHGLWKQQANKVLAEYKADKDYVPQKWEDDIEGYPLEYLGALWYSVRRFTYAWLLENWPKSFCIPMFKD